jgi:hypothetical protein
MRQGGKLEGKLNDQWFRLTLPGDWRLDLADVPGCDPDSRVVRLTTNKDVLVDNEKKLIGYLGRAHPLVRHAIDRVRHTSLGDGSGKTDTRAAVVKADVKEPTIYCTFLARVNSAAGREFERVVAVRLTKSAAPVFCPDPQEWLRLASLDSALSPVGVWEKQFAAWAKSKLNGAAKLAADSFAAAGSTFLAEAKASIERERKELDAWLTERASEFSPPSQQQPNLFEKAKPDGKPKAAPSTPAERLAAIHEETDRPARQRSDADAILKIYQQRLAKLNIRGQFSPPEVIPLGLLMVLPEGVKHGA